MAKQNTVLTKYGTPVHVYGEGQPIILIHGVMVDKRMWLRQIESLKPYHRLLCIDMLGHGDAPDPPGERTLDDFVDQVQDVVDCFSDDGPPILAGFSMGGLVAAAFAIEHHAMLAGLVLLNTVYDRSEDESERVKARYGDNLKLGVDNAIRSGLDRWFTDEDRVHEPAVVADVETWMRHGDFAAKCKAHRVFVSSDGYLTGRLKHIRCPTLVMTGERDSGSTPAMTRKIAAAIANAESHVLKDQHHMMPILAADRVNSIIHRFLNTGL